MIQQRISHAAATITAALPRKRMSVCRTPTIIESKSVNHSTVLQQHTSAIVPTRLNMKEMRLNRQKANDTTVLNALLNQDTTYKQLVSVCNEEELKRNLQSLECTFEELKLQCRVSPTFGAVQTSKLISKNASRQGTADEDYVLKTCNATTKLVGVEIENLPNTAFRPTKDGRILDKTAFNNSGLKKNDALKSFDGRLTGNVKGWIFAKITITNGGHQDNVFEEAHSMGDWIVKYGDPTLLYILLIDTDLTAQFKELRSKYHNGATLLVVDHIELQQHFIDLHKVPK